MIMNIHLNRKMVAPAAIASVTVATAALGALAFVLKKRSNTRAQYESEDKADRDLKSNIGPGEINPYADTPTDPANQN
jgi:hypothetical protein